MCLLKSEITFLALRKSTKNWMWAVSRCLWTCLKLYTLVSRRLEQLCFLLCTGIVLSLEVEQRVNLKSLLKLIKTHGGGEDCISRTRVLVTQKFQWRASELGRRWTIWTTSCVKNGRKCWRKKYPVCSRRPPTQCPNDSWSRGQWQRLCVRISTWMKFVRR